MAAARRKSITRWRVGGVAAATRSARDSTGSTVARDDPDLSVDMEVMVPPPRARGGWFGPQP
ncbi:hypothetical protein GCM10022204_21700 [Microlunatus aurantiacus]|uniref:Uncharacterized protein n=1 Tax=Microlunatus aurantiacus TaxID=446786 RepID=A0ABP7DD91_9ACTN